MADLEVAFRQSARDMVVAHAQDASTIVTSVDRLQDSLDFSISNLDESLGALVSTVEAGFSDLSYQLRFQSGQMQEILETLQTPLDTQSKELRKRAQEAYVNGWIDDAEKDFRESEALNRYDFTIHQSLGNISFFHRDDLDTAETCYENAAKYALPKSARDTAYALISLAGVHEARGDMSTALSKAEEAVNVAHGLPEAHYALARYQVANKKGATEIVENLLAAFRGHARGRPTFDAANCWEGQSYRIDLCIFADTDRVLTERRDLVEKALMEFNAELRELAVLRYEGLSQLLSSLDSYLAAYRSKSIRQVRDECGGCLQTAHELLKRDAILDLGDACHRLRRTALEASMKGVSTARERASSLAQKDQQARSKAAEAAQSVRNLASLFVGGAAAVALVVGVAYAGNAFGVVFAMPGAVIGYVAHAICVAYVKDNFVTHEEQITASEALANKIERFRLKVQGTQCDACYGQGVVVGTGKPCAKCGGRGFIRSSS